MGFSEYLQTNRPPKPLVDWIKKKFGIETFDQTDPGLWFAVTTAAGFVSWLQQDAGTMWLYGINGVRRITPGPWDIFTSVEGTRRTSLNSNIIFAWDRDRPDQSNGPIRGAAEHIRYVFRQFKIAVPAQVVEYLRLPDETTQSQFQNKVAMAASMAAAGWFSTKEGIALTIQTQAVIRASRAHQERIYSELLVPILPPRFVEHTRKTATDSCEECGIFEPCVEQERDGAMCRRCAGFSPRAVANDAHATCSRCDIVDCNHWKDLFTVSEKQEWLLTVR